MRIMKLDFCVVKCEKLTKSTYVPKNKSFDNTFLMVKPILTQTIFLRRQSISNSGLITRILNPF